MLKFINSMYHIPARVIVLLTIWFLYLTALTLCWCLSAPKSYGQSTYYYTYPTFGGGQYTYGSDGSYYRQNPDGTGNAYVPAPFKIIEPPPIGPRPQPRYFTPYTPLPVTPRQGPRLPLGY